MEKAHKKRYRRNCCTIRLAILFLVFSLVIMFGALLIGILLSSHTAQSDISMSLMQTLVREVQEQINDLAGELITTAQSIAREFVAQDRFSQKTNASELDLFRVLYPHSFQKASGLSFLSMQGMINTLVAWEGNRTVYYCDPVTHKYARYAIRYNETMDPNSPYMTAVFDIAKGTQNPHKYWSWFYRKLKEGPKEGLWTTVGNSISRGQLTIAYGVPIFGHDGTYYGASNADYTLSLLTDLLAGIRVGKSGHIFVTDASTGKLMASSKEKHNSQQVYAVEAQNPITRAAALFTQRNGPDLKFNSVYELNLDDCKYFLSVTDMTMDKTGYKWWVHILIPRSDYFSMFDAVILVTYIVTASLVSFAVVFGCLCTSLMTRSLRRVIREIDAVVSYSENAFHVRRRRSGPFQLREFAKIQDTVTRMKIILQSFEKYIPQQLLRYLVKSNRPAKLGLERSNATVMFVDVVDFTSIMESARVDKLIAQFTEYSNEVIRIIVENHGTLDKMMGDGLMAFFGAPPTPLANHEAWACRAALQIQIRLRELRREWAKTERGYPLHVRVGMASGNVAVGNVGSTSRFQYTVLGDIVNLASRIEGTNKFFGTQVLMSHSTWNRLDTDMFTGRLLATIRVKGRSHRTRVYELLTSREMVDFDTFPPPMEVKAKGRIMKIPIAFPPGFSGHGSQVDSYRGGAHTGRSLGGLTGRSMTGSTTAGCLMMTTGRSLGTGGSDDMFRPGTGVSSVSAHSRATEFHLQLIAEENIQGEAPTQGADQEVIPPAQPLSAFEEQPKPHTQAEAETLVATCGVASSAGTDSEREEEEAEQEADLETQKLPACVIELSRLAHIFTQAIKHYDRAEFGPAARLLRIFVDSGFTPLQKKVHQLELAVYRRRTGKSDGEAPPPPYHIADPESKAPPPTEGSTSNTNTTRNSSLLHPTTELNQTVDTPIMSPALRVPHEDEVQGTPTPIFDVAHALASGSQSAHNMTGRDLLSGCCTGYARNLLMICEEFMRTEPPLEWSPVITLDSK